MLHEYALAIAEFMRLAGHRAHRKILCQIARCLHDIRHLTAVSACVHEQSAAQTARNASCKFQSAQTRSARLVGQYGQQHTGLRRDGVSFDCHLTEFRADAEHRTADPLIAHQYIGAVAEHCQRRAAFAHQTHRLNQRVLGMRTQIQVCRSADAEGGVTAHRLVTQHLQSCNRPEFFY